MKNFIKNNRHWLKIVIVIATIIFAAGRISNSYDHLCKEVNNKVDKEIYELDRRHLERELDLRLQRIEEKIDAISKSLENASGRPGD